LEDIILSTIYTSVPLMERPVNFPINTESVSEKLNMSVEELSSHLRVLLEREYIKVAMAHKAPLLYLTYTGVSRVERLCNEPFDKNLAPLF